MYPYKEVNAVLKIDQLQEYVNLAKTLNFSEAAKLSFITQPAFSRHIREIEEEMDARLFERDTRNVSLTPAGSAVLEEFEEILLRFQSAHERARLLSSGKSGNIVMLSPYYWTGDYAEPLIERFHAEEPLCDVSVISCQPAEGYLKLIGGEGDVLLHISLGGQKDDTQTLEVGHERLAAMLPRDHPLAGKDSLVLSELAGCSFAFLSEGIIASTRFNSTIMGMLASRGIEVASPHYSQQIDTLGMTIKETGCVGLMPYGVRHMDRPYLRVVPLSDDDCVFPMCLFWRKDNENPALDDFIEMARISSTPARSLVLNNDAGGSTASRDVS